MKTKNTKRKKAAVKEYKCTDCGRDATLGMSNWSDINTGKPIIGRKERLCLACSSKRFKEHNMGFSNFFAKS